MAIGRYAVICKADDGNFVETKLLNVVSNGQSTASFRILKGEIKTVVEVVGDTPPVAVDGLRSLLTEEEKEKAATTEGYKVEIKLTADEKNETEAEGAEDIKEQLGGNQTIDQILDFSLMKNITSNGETTSEGISEASSVLEIAIPYDLATNKVLSMFRFHGGVAEMLERLASMPKTLIDGTFFYDAAANFIHLFSSRFSTYAIATEEKSSTSGGSGSSSSSSSIATVPVYRLFSAKAGYHFYTMDASERDALVTAGWTDEGIAWQTVAKAGKPVYRLFDVNGNGGHIFTTSEEEKASYIAKGYRDEGIGWYAPSYAGRKVYKITNKTNGHVLYTISLDEKNALEAAGFICEEAEFVVY